MKGQHNFGKEPVYVRWEVGFIMGMLEKRRVSVDGAGVGSFACAVPISPERRTIARPTAFNTDRCVASQPRKTVGVVAIKSAPFSMEWKEVYAFPHRPYDLRRLG